jgi:hypothetical protein
MRLLESFSPGRKAKLRQGIAPVHIFSSFSFQKSDLLIFLKRVNTRERLGSQRVARLAYVQGTARTDEAFFSQVTHKCASCKLVYASSFTLRGYV